MDELAAVDASVGMRVGIEELLQTITSPHVSVRVVADALDLGGREWFGGRNVADDPRLAGCVAIDRCALGSREGGLADLAVNHDRGVRVVCSGDSRKGGLQWTYGFARKVYPLTVDAYFGSPNWFARAVAFKREGFGEESSLTLTGWGQLWNPLPKSFKGFRERDVCRSFLKHIGPIQKTNKIRSF